MSCWRWNRCAPHTGSAPKMAASTACRAARVDEARVQRGKFVGQSIPRFEDLRFITGRGRYTDDIKIDGAAHAIFARADHAHAAVESIDIAAAKAAPGVIAVLTAEDYLADGHVAMKHIPIPVDAVDPKAPAFKRETTFDKGHVPLVQDRVRHVGEALVMVIAETLAEAIAAADLVEAVMTPLPVVIDTDAATAQGAPQLYDDAPGNVCFEENFGNPEATAAAFAEAHLVVEGVFKNSRIVTCQMEPRSAIGSYDPDTDTYQLLSGSQGAVRQRLELAQALAVPIERTVVICPDTGGGFGTRTTLYLEQLLVVWAAKRIGRPVRWTSTRSEAFLSDYQGRGLTTRSRMAFDKQGKILAMYSEVDGNVGAHTVSYVPVSNNQRVTTTTYHVPTAHVRSRGVLTNTTPTVPFRGAGRPEAHLTIERLIEMAAPRLGIDRIELRRRNLVRRDQLPYRNALGLTYDSGDFLGNLDRALALSGWDDFPARRRESATRGLLRGIGLANYVESPVGAVREQMTVTVAEDGTIEVLAGTQSTGQGHETTFLQVVADGLQLDMTAIRLVTGDTRIIQVGGGTHSDRSMRLGGTLLVQACAEICARAKEIVAQHIGQPVEEILHEDGLFSHKASNRAFMLGEVSGLSIRAGDGPISSTTTFFGRIPAYPTGAAVCELEIDPETGVVTIVRYSSVDDVGQPINPLVVDGQTHGGIAQGIGQALMEDLQLDPETGQVLGGSFMDYGVPRADHLPSFDVELVEDPTYGNPLRVKGGGESGITPALATVSNAIADALSPYGIEHIELPATPQRVWRLIHHAEKADPIMTRSQAHG
jgi:carbon-monoxide dehydrogenase large subunit